MTTVVVAGGAGLLGMAVTRALLASSKRVVVADNFGDYGDGRAVKLDRIGAIGKNPRVEIARVDLTDEASARDLFREHRPESVVNAALFPPDGPGLSPLLAAAAASGIRYFVHLSDGALYGAPPEPGSRAKEDEPVDPGEDPGLSRRAREEESVRRAGLPATVLRVFPLVGPGFPASRFPASAFEAMLRDEEILLPDDDERDLTSIDDAARGVVLTLVRRPAGATINLGTGSLSRPSDLVQALATRTGRRPRIRTIGGEELHRPHRAADMTAAWTTIGFAPERSIADVAQTIVDERFAERTSSRRVGWSPGPGTSAPVPRDEPREVSRRDLFGLLRRPFAGRDGGPK